MLNTIQKSTYRCSSFRSIHRYMASSTQIVEQVGEDTVSRVVLVPVPQHNGAPLTCTAASRTLKDPAVSSTVNLNVTRE